MRLYPEQLDWLTLTSSILSIAGFCVSVLIAVVGNKKLNTLLRFRDYHTDLATRYEELLQLLTAPSRNHNDVGVLVSQMHGIITAIPKNDQKRIKDAYDSAIQVISSYQRTRSDDAAWKVVNASATLIERLRQIGKRV
jgi:hypothetical protein